MTPSPQEEADDGELTFTNDLPERLTTVEAGFGQRMGRALDAYVVAAGIDAPVPLPAPVDD